MVGVLVAPGSRSEWCRVPVGSSPAPPESFTQLCKQAGEPSPDSTRFATPLAVKCVYPGEAGMGAPRDMPVLPAWDGVPAESTAPCQPCRAAPLKAAGGTPRKRIGSVFGLVCFFFSVWDSGFFLFGRCWCFSPFWQALFGAAQYVPGGSNCCLFIIMLGPSK